MKANACLTDKYGLMKGTSNRERMLIILVIDRVSTLCNDAESQLIDDNFGRSNESNQINQTSQIQ